MVFMTTRTIARFLLSTLLVSSLLPAVVAAQGRPKPSGVIPRADQLGATDDPDGYPSASAAPVSSIALYFDPVQGSSSSDLVRRALASNAELAAARLEIERARARLQQARLRPNPVLDFEQTTGRWTGSQGERETSIGLALPLELGGKRARRIDLARAELEAVEAEVADRDRRLAADVRAAYAEAVAAIRELEITENINVVDRQTAQVVQVRVTEGESAPIEVNLLQAEVERIKARRALVEGRLQAAMFRLKNLAGMAPSDPLRLGEDLASPLLPDPPPSLEAALDIALRTRPDLKLARLNEEAAQAGLRLSRARSTPDVTAFSKYTRTNGVFDDTPVGILRDRDNLLTFGVSISIPVFNRNQGVTAEAGAAVEQARRRREFVEAVIRAEVASAYARHQAASSAVTTLLQGVLARSQQNINSVRGAYEIGAFRVTDLLVEQRRFLDAQREFIETLAERYRALADLQSALGIPFKQ